jgi:hypothetical protein
MILRITGFIAVGWVSHPPGRAGCPSRKNYRCFNSDVLVALSENRVFAGSALRFGFLVPNTLLHRRVCFLLEEFGGLAELSADTFHNSFVGVTAVDYTLRLCREWGGIGAAIEGLDVPQLLNTIVLR